MPGTANTPPHHGTFLRHHLAIRHASAAPLWRLHARARFSTSPEAYLAGRAAAWPTVAELAVVRRLGQVYPMNYFAHQTAAERYARHRPYFHPLIVERIRAFLHLERPVAVALDVACGTGQSALALTEIAQSIIATDVAPSMLAQAPAHERIRYVEAPAEQLPLGDSSADLMTVSLAFHWFDRCRFLAEALRILRPGATLVIYGNGFYGQMAENPEFARWNRESYLTRYPTPARHDQPFTGEDAQASGFLFVERERYTNEISFSPEQLAQYLMTQSNVIAAVEQGHETLADVHSWLLHTVSPLFPSPQGTFLFGGEIWFLSPSPDLAPQQTAPAVAEPGDVRQLRTP